MGLLSNLERRRRQWDARRGLPMNYDAFAQILRSMHCPACGRKLHNCGLGYMGCERCQRFWVDENINDCFGGCYRVWMEGRHPPKLGWAARGEPNPYSDPAPWPRPRSIVALLIDIGRFLIPPPPKVKPEPAELPRPKHLELPSPWEPGCTAFWLDPELWSRTPEVNGRPDICWMYLEPPPAKTPRLPNRISISRRPRSSSNGWSTIARIGA
jgi:hypothetical protein